MDSTQAPLLLVKSAEIVKYYPGTLLSAKTYHARILILDYVLFFQSCLKSHTSVAAPWNVSTLLAE